MRVLLTGASGQVGTEFLRRRIGSHLELIAPPRAQLDLSRTGEIEAAVAAIAPDFVVNAGAYTAVDRAEDERDLAHAVNGAALGHLGAACARLGAPLVHFSTDYVFTGDKSGPYLPDDPTGPIGAYGASKLAGEQALAASGARAVTLRVSWVFAGHGTNFVRTMLRLGREREELRVVDDQRGGPTWAGHIAQAALDLAQRFRTQGALPWGTYHYAGAPDISWCGFAGAIFEEGVRSGALARAPRLVPITTDQYPTKARRPANSTMDCGSAQAVLGLARPEWREGLRVSLAELAAAQ